MSGVKHTPGPWSDKGGSAGAVWAGNEFIASVYPNAQPGWDGYGRFDRQDETEANARLIASSPDLLEALIEARLTLSLIRTNIMVEMKKSEGGAYRWEGVPELLANRIAQCDAAIARARGEQDGGGE